MTKVLDRPQPTFMLAFCLLAAMARAQAVPASANCPQTTAALYSRLRSLGLDEQRVYRVRGAAIDRPNLQLVFDAGTLAFTEDVCGRITGAFFEGEGEILLRPPNHVERASLALFTGMAILEEQFSSGYLRFNDETAASLQPFLSPVPEAGEFVKRWNDMSRGLAESDTLRFLVDFSHFLPTPGGVEPAREFPRLLHAHLQGKKLGGFEVYWDAAAAEPLWAGQIRFREGIPFWDVWTSFTPGGRDGIGRSPGSPAGDVAITSFRIRASVQPPTSLRASAEVDVLVRTGGRRTLLFELSRYLKVDAVLMNGQPLDLIQNQALEGTQLRRKGNDLIAVVVSAPLESGQKLKMLFSYAGEVLSEAGSGLLYVGERGTWYPSFGFSPAQFDLEFQYPANWTLVATGKQIAAAAPAEAPALQVSHWVSEGPIAVAGFNLGKYIRAEAKSGNVVVQAYGTAGVERSFPKAPAEMIQPQPSFPGPRAPMPMVVAPPPPPSPARNAQAVADKAARAIGSFSQWFGPYPFGSLALTQMPGDVSQGWPGLVFLSSYAFLNPQEQADLHLDPVLALLSNQVLVHETAHQWWGDLVLWSSYRDQWLVEGLANYSALLVLEQQNPGQFRQILEKYRSDLLSKNKDGEPLRDAGPVTLGQRLISSHFPGGYEAISYERGTWLFHMLRCMLRDSEAVSRSRNGPAHAEEPFFRALHKARERYAGKSIATGQLLQVFEEELPRSLWYENRRSLDWFLEGWINGTAMPHLEAHDVRITPKDRGVSVAGTITQKDAPDNLVTAVPVYGVTGGNSTVLLGLVLADGLETSFRLNAPAGTHKIVLDPRQTVLTTLK
ncbi:MAG: M1 family aminopeptidase [Terriglobales bacterium]